MGGMPKALSFALFIRTSDVRTPTVAPVHRLEPLTLHKRYRNKLPRPDGSIACIVWSDFWFFGESTNS